MAPGCTQFCSSWALSWNFFSGIILFVTPHCRSQLTLNVILKSWTPNFFKWLVRSSLLRLQHGLTTAAPSPLPILAWLGSNRGDEVVFSFGDSEAFSIRVFGELTCQWWTASLHKPYCSFTVGVSEFLVDVECCRLSLPSHANALPVIRFLNSFFSFRSLA